MTSETERLLIFCLVMRQEYADEIVGSLEPRYFLDTPLREAFKLAKELYDKQQFTYATFTDALLKARLFEALNVASVNPITTFPETVTRDDVSKMISWMKERYAKTCLNYSINLKPQEIMALLSPANAASTTLDMKRYQQFMMEMLAKDAMTIPYPFALLNDRITGMKKKEYMIVAARPSVGKSVMLEQIHWNAVKLKKKSLFISIEMSLDQVIKRHIMRTSGIDLFHQQVGPEQKLRLYDQIKEELGDNVIIDGVLSPADIGQAIEVHQPDIVLVDYLQRVKSPSNARYSEKDRIAWISQQLAAMKKKYDVALVVACQYKRLQVKQVQPVLSDLKESGDIEQDADVVLSLWKQDETFLNGCKKVYVDCLKNRNGRTFGNGPGFEFCLSFAPEHVRFYNTDEAPDFSNGPVLPVVGQQDLGETHVDGMWVKI